MIDVLSCGLDLGNGWIKAALPNEDDKVRVSKIPNWSTESEPKGQLNSKTMLAAKPVAFSLILSNTMRWFGQDTLSLAGHQEIDQDKLKPDYIRMMFKAVLFRWLDQHNVDPDWLSHRRLNVVCGMPPELYQDRQARSKTDKIYREVFNQNKPDYINLPNEGAIAFFTRFGGLKPETLAWRSANSLKPGFTLLVDLGYGTSDLCLLHSSREMPVSTVTLNNGLLHSHNESNPIRPWESELATMRGVSPRNYANITKAKIRQIARQIKLTQLVIFGGGVRLLDKDALKDLQTYAETVSCGTGYDEFSNSRWFEIISRDALKEQKNES